MACSFSAVNGFIWAAFIHVAIQRRFSRSTKKRTWQNYWFGGFLTRLTRGTLRKKSLPSLSRPFFRSPCLCTSRSLWVVHLHQNKLNEVFDCERKSVFACLSVCVCACCHINNHLPRPYTKPHSKTTKSHIQQEWTGRKLLKWDTLWPLDLIAHQHTNTHTPSSNQTAQTELKNTSQHKAQSVLFSCRL